MELILELEPGMGRGLEWGLDLGLGLGLVLVAELGLGRGLEPWPRTEVEQG